jgi:hypothetical protein
VFAVGVTKRTRKSVEQVASKTQDEAPAMKSLLDTKPTASVLSVSVDDDDPTEEEVEQAVRFSTEVLGTFLHPGTRK